ncbi:BnaA06g00670D [Brassica napus]|uniref:BnaA06g00670D protein n=1 Tax=Brassica napus TaxID=3708 RepID=A0A078GFH1_BRANA|nr:BnaA06g00670D [Brassica napus]
MVQIHPVQAVPVDSGIGEVKSSPYVTTEQESFTIWMRSLSCGEVYLMDLYGEVLFEFQQKFGLFKSCEGCNSNGTRFRLRKNFKISSRGSSSSYKVVMESSKDDQQSCYKILNHGSVFTIEDGSGRFMAEVKKKRSNVNGLDFGEDVLTMVVEPQVDHSFIMGIVIAYGLLKSKL